jgi:hypothetical protein
MRIGIGLNLLAPDNGGVTNYTLTLLRNWATHAPGHPMVLFSFAHNEPLLATLPPEARQHEIRLQTQEEALDHFDKIDVYFCPFGTLWPRPVRKPSVLTFHDMQERFYPEFFTEKEMHERFFHYDWSLRMADAVVTISDFTRAMATELVGVPRSSCTVVHHIPDELPPPECPSAWSATPRTRPLSFSQRIFGGTRTMPVCCGRWPRPVREGLKSIWFAPAACSDASPSGDKASRRWGWRIGSFIWAKCGARKSAGCISMPAPCSSLRSSRVLAFPCWKPCSPAVRSRAVATPASPKSRNQRPCTLTRRTWSRSPPRSCGSVPTLPLRARLCRAGAERIKAFSAEAQVRGHLAAFAAACRRHTRLRRWWNERWRLPESHHMRQHLTDRERHVAAALLRSRAHVPAHFESIP